MSRRVSFFLLALLVGNAGVSYSQTPKTKKTRVRLECGDNSLYTVVRGRKHYIGQQYPYNPPEWTAILDPADRQVFYAHTTGCGYENEGMTLFSSDIYGRRSEPILVRCEMLNPAGLIKFNGRSYLLIEQTNGGTVRGTSLWLYDVRAKRFALHAEGVIKKRGKGLFSYGYFGDEEKLIPVGMMRVNDLINKRRFLRLLPRQTHALTLRRNTKVFATDLECSVKEDKRYEMIRHAGTKVLIAGECSGGGYEIQYDEKRGMVKEGSLKILW